MPNLRESASRFLSGGEDPIVPELREELRTALANEGLFAESLAELELQLRGDEGWRRLAQTMNQEFSREGIAILVEVSRAMYLSHPLIQRGVNLNTYYTWAQGFQFKAKEGRIQEEVVDLTIAEEGNQAEFYGYQSRVLTDVDQMVDGSIFLALFTDDQGDVKVRSVPHEQMTEIITNPQDVLQVRFYRRRWSQKEFNERDGTYITKEYECLYPDISYQPRTKPESIGNISVKWDAPIIHSKVGGLKHMMFGVPQTYAALDWARAYKKFLEDWHTVVSSLARFAWRASVGGSKAQKLRDRLRRRGRPELAEGGGDDEDHGAPVAGAVWADKADLTPIQKSGAYTSAADAKQSRLMVGTTFDLPDTMLSGDPQQGNLATATTLDRPTELAMRNRQSLWNAFDARVWRYIVDAKVRRGRLPGRVVRTADGTFVEPGIDPMVATVFPPILEHEPKDTVAAIVTAATLDGKTEAGLIPREQLARSLMNAIGVEDIDAAVKELGDLENTQLGDAMDRLAKALGQNGGGDPTPKPAPAEQ